jgi:hypothetical protein
MTGENWFSGYQEKYDFSQFFFTSATSDRLASVVARPGRIACIGTPTVFEILVCNGFDATLFDIDRGLRSVIPSWYSERFVHLDVNTGIWNAQGCSRRAHLFANSFQTILIDPPFERLKLEFITKIIGELLDYKIKSSAVVFMVHQAMRACLIRSAFEKQAGMLSTVRSDVVIDYKCDKLKPHTEKYPVVLFEFRLPESY